MLNAEGAYYAGIRLFSTLSSSIRSLNHDIKYVGEYWKIIFYLILSAL
jgi:hypothetical protein